MNRTPASRSGDASRASTRRTFLLATLLLLAAGALRFWRLDAGWFGIDQARDAAWAERIARGGAWPDAGPAMRNHVRLGATYYFFWALPALLVDSPLAGYAFAAFLGTAAVAAAGALAWSVAGPTAGLAALLWLGFHPAAVIDSRVAWAPAAVPAACAVFLWAGRRLLRAPDRTNAAIVGLVSGFATQLHLATVSFLPVAAGALLSRFGRIGRAGLLAAAVGFSLVLLPMAVAVRDPIPATVGSMAAGPASTTDQVSPYANRLLDFLFVVPRFLSGLTPPYRALPGPARVWIPLEIVATLVPIAAVGWLALRTRAVREPGTLRLVLATFVATTAIPLALPTDVWCYYLDGRFVAGAIAVGVAVALAGRPWLLAALCVTTVCRTALLAWWVWAVSTTGWVPANLDYLRVGGPRPSELSGRAQLFTVATKRALSDAVVDTIGAVVRPLRWDLHGMAVEDFDTDNGYFLLREARERGVPPATGNDVLFLPPGKIPPSWIDGFRGRRSLRLLDVYEYEAVVHPERGVLEGCATGPVPAPPVSDPVDYGAGEPRHAAWPCAEPIVRVPFDAPPAGAAVRVFPRLSGAGRIEILSVEPPVEVYRPGLPGLDRGVTLPRSAGEIRMRLVLEGPATLDMVELHGRAPLAPAVSSPSEPSPPPESGEIPDALRADSDRATAGRG